MKEFFKAIAQAGLTPNQLGVLVGATYNMSGFITKSELDNLYTMGHIVRSEGPIPVSLTTSGKKILRELESGHFPKKKKVRKRVMTEQDRRNIATYRELFPPGRPAQHGHLVRTNVKELEARFAWFFENYPEYSWEQILNATAEYIRKSGESAHSHLMVSKYFIYKQDPGGMYRSDLASYCETSDQEAQAPVQTYTPLYNIR